MAWSFIYLIYKIKDILLEIIKQSLIVFSVLQFEIIVLIIMNEIKVLLSRIPFLDLLVHYS